MITEKELHEAIAECQGVKNPNANTCMKLASYYTILDHMVPPVYSFASEPERIRFQSDTAFSQAVQRMNPEDAWAVMDELMTTLTVVNPRLYASVMRKLEG